MRHENMRSFNDEHKHPCGWLLQVVSPGSFQHCLTLPFGTEGRATDKRKRDEEDEIGVLKKKLQATTFGSGKEASWEAIAIEMLEEVRNSLEMKVKARDALEKVADVLEGIAATYGLYVPSADSTESEYETQAEEEINEGSEEEEGTERTI